MKLVRTLYICCLLIFVFNSWSFAYDNRPIFVLREDDGRSTCRDVFHEFGDTSFLEYGKQLKMPVTWAVITNETSSGAYGALSWAELIDYVTNAGGELASHSATHAQMDSLQAYIDDLLLSKSAIQANTPFICNTFLQPGTWAGGASFDSYAKMDNILGQAIQNNFSQSMMYLPFGRLGIGPPILKHGLQVNCGIDYQDAPVKDDLFRSIDYMSQIPGIIYVITFHGIQSSTGTLDYHTRADLMAALLTKLADLREAGLIRIASINDAYNNNQFSPDINRLFDSGFELYDSRLGKYVTVWNVSGGNTITNQDGYNSSKCCHIVSGGDLHQNIYLPSGRFKLSWMQKPDSISTQNDSVVPLLIATNIINNTQYNVVGYPSYKNTSSTWAANSVIFKVPDKANKIYARLYSTNAFFIDNVSIQKIDTDPYECVSQLKAIPTPDGLQLSWRAPDNTDYKNIYFEYNIYQRSPQTLDESTKIKIVPAENGKGQSCFWPISWAGKTTMYLSAFAVKEDNKTYSDPDVEFIAADQTKPLITDIKTTASNSGTVYASWTAIDNSSSIYTAKYSLGTSPSGSNIIDWTTDNDFTATIANLAPGSKYYLNVQAENNFGVWSDVKSTSFIIMSQQPLLMNPNETYISTTGVVSAIFNGFYYIQLKDSMTGVKVVGPTDSIELGETVTVEGTLTTDAGERYIQVPLATR